MKLVADQLIYTRVEPAYSPKRKGGYQTVYRPDGLADAQVAEIEKRIQCFFGGRLGMSRLQSFPLDDNRWVISHTCVIPSDREIVDKTGRAGAFLAHCLILSRTAFRQTDADPFVVIDAFPFFDDAEAMVEELGMGGGNAPDITLSLAPSTPTTTMAYSEEATKRLLTEVAQAETTLSKAQSLFLIGEPDTIVDTLRMAVAFAPDTATRLHCSFDSHIDRCSVRPGDYWAVGTTRRYGTQRGFITVDTITGKIEGDTSGASSARHDIYSRWIDQALRRHSLATVLEWAPSVRPLCQALEERGIWDESSGSDAAIEDFFGELGREIAKTRLKTGLKPWLGPKVRRKLIDDLSGERCTARLLLRLALKPLTPNRELAERLCELISRDPPSLPWSEWRKMRKFARRAEHWLLLHRSATLPATTNKRARDQALAQMDEAAFSDAVGLLGRPVAAVDFVAQRHLARLVQELDITTLHGEEYFQLVQSIIRLNQGEELANLVTPVESLSIRRVCKLHRMLRRRYPCAKSFHEAIKKRIEQFAKTFRWYIFCSVMPYSEGRTKDA
jgi:hypothetical protein